MATLADRESPRRPRGDQTRPRRRRDARVPVNCPLSHEQLRAVRLLSQGLTYEEIATATGRRASTVRSHLHGAYRRLHVTASYQAVLECAKAGWLDWDPGRPEQAQLLRVEELLQQLLEAHDTRREFEALTFTQRAYLAAFDDFLKAGSRGEHERSRGQMDRSLATMLREAGIPPGHGQRRLVAHLGGLTKLTVSRTRQPAVRPHRDGDRPAGIDAEATDQAA